MADGQRRRLGRRRQETPPHVALGNLGLLCCCRRVHEEVSAVEHVPGTCSQQPWERRRGIFCGHGPAYCGVEAGPSCPWAGGQRGHVQEVVLVVIGLRPWKLVAGMVAGSLEG